MKFFLTNKIRFPIKFKVIGLIVLMTMATLTIYHLAAVDLFKKDKSAYLVETNLSRVESLKNEIKSILDSYEQVLESFSTLYSLGTSNQIIQKSLNQKNNLLHLKQISLSTKKENAFTNKSINANLNLPKNYFTDAQIPIDFISIKRQKTTLLTTLLYNSHESLSVISYYHSKTDSVFIGFFSNTAFVNLLKKNTIYNNFIYNSDASLLFNTPIAKSHFLKKEVVEDILNQRINDGVNELTNQDGKRILISHTFLDKYKLLIISRVSKDKAFTGLNALLSKSVYFAIFIISIAAILGILLSRQLTSPIEKLSNATLKLAQGELGTHVEINSNDEVGILSQSFNHMSKELINHIEQVKDKAKLENELELANMVQNSFLPEKQIQYRGLDLVSYYQSASKCSGDWWGVLPLENKLIVLIGDATGHGIGPALITATINTTFYSLKNDKKTLNSPASIMKKLNHSICQVGSDILMTFFIAVINTEDKTIKYSNAGHCPAILYKNNNQCADSTAKKENLVSLDKNNGLRLGLNSSTIYKESTITYQESDTLIMYTDGIVELQNDKQKIWGYRRFFKSILESISKESRFINQNIIDSVYKFIEGNKLDDDITLITIKLNNWPYKNQAVALIKDIDDNFNTEIQKYYKIIDNISLYDCDNIFLSQGSLLKTLNEKYISKLQEKLVLISKANSEDNITQYLGIRPIYHLIGYNSRSIKQELQLIQTKGQVKIDSLFQLSNVKEYILTSSDQINYVCQQWLFEHIDSNLGRLQEGIQIACNELLTNSIYNAPRDEKGNRIYKETQRNLNIDLPDNHDVKVKLAQNDHALMLQVTDSFGQLERDEIIHYILRGYEVAHSEDKKGGAGLGLFMVFEYSNILIVRKKSHQWTEISLIIEKQRYKQYKERIKSFHFFEV
ncbi:MAG: SpoIIE family protein phosphatase [Bacteriovoracaceae bacterium]|jgi:sigma-B regulation protein RsbU (phosphoserine phosphatase)|nr:SpoIIE family protein phosphatase [Bacteriovoracaceae bacterium]